MKVNGTLLPETYLKNPQYFDERLIQTLANSEKENATLKERVACLRADNSSLKYKCVGYETKLKDKEAIIHNLKLEIKSGKEKIEEVEKEIHEIRDEVKKDREKYEEIIDKQQDIINDLQKLIERYKKMCEPIKKNSKNSSLPPSHDFVSLKANVNNRIKSNRKPGGQDGHTAHRSSLSLNASHIVVKRVKKAPLGAEKRVDASGTEYYVTQEISAAFNTVVTETHYYLDMNGETLEQEVMDKYKINSSAYSADLKAKVLYLNSKGVIAQDRLCSMINELTDNQLNISAGTISLWLKEFSKKSQPKREEILEKALDEKVLHVDETSYRCNGDCAWVHTICNNSFSYYVMTSSRGVCENSPIKLLARYRNVLCHDHFKPYYRLMCKHSECNAHIIRYLTAGNQIDNSKSCKDMIELLQSTLAEKNELIKQEKDHMSPERLAEISTQYDEIIDRELTPFLLKKKRNKKLKLSESLKVLKRMKEYKEEHLRYLYDFNVEFTNNAAESACRMVKQHRKIKGQCKTIETGNYLMDVLTIIETAKKQKKNVLKEMESILK